jgi:hypothetical protein
MLNRSLIVASAVAMLGFASYVSAETQIVYLGGHEPMRTIVVQPVPVQTNAPYALTGSDTKVNNNTQVQPIRVDSRIVGYVTK